MKIFDVGIKGIAPLLMHRFLEGTAENKVQKRTGPHDASHEAEEGLYQYPDGTIYHPADHILGAIRQASKDFRITGKRARSYSHLVEAQVRIEPEAIPHKIQKWVADARSVVLRSTGARIMRYRPRFDEWALDFRLIVKDDEIPVEVIKGILDHAGANEGIGDYRPRFGLFMVTKFEETKEGG